MIIINFKNYKQGKDVLTLAKKLEKYKNKIVVCVPATDISEVHKTKLKVYAQHVNYQNKGKTTGYIFPESIKAAGASGSLLNHSEHKTKEIKEIIKRCNKLNLKLIVCATTLREIESIKKLKPYAIAFEDPKLIATGKSITKYRTTDLKKFVGFLKKTKIIPLCGAGINSKEDYDEALKLGCKGILISSAIVNSKDPTKFLKDVFQ